MLVQNWDHSSGEKVLHMHSWSGSCITKLPPGLCLWPEKKIIADKKIMDIATAATGKRKLILLDFFLARILYVLFLIFKNLHTRRLFMGYVT